MPPPEETKFVFAAADARYKQLISNNLLLVGETLTPGMLAVLRENACHELDLEETPALLELLSGYALKTLDAALYKQIAWRLAAGYDGLAENRRLETDFRAIKPYWSTLRVDDIWYGRPSRDGNAMLELSMFVYDGAFAGLWMQQRIGYAWVMHKLATDIGFPRFKPVHKNELVQARYVGLLDATGAAVAVTENATSPAAKAYTAKLRRARANHYCVMPDKQACETCVLGYEFDANDVTASCPLGTHARTYVRRMCDCCKVVSWFDPSRPQSDCLPCVAAANRRLLRMKGKG